MLVDISMFGVIYFYKFFNLLFFMKLDSVTNVEGVESDDNPMASQLKALDIRKKMSLEELASQNKLFEKNKGLVIAIANTYVRKGKNGKYFGAEMDDIVQMGMLGLMRACLSYDDGQGKFSTYASFWIKRTITGYVFDNLGPVRLPENQRTLLNQYKKVELYIGSQDEASTVSTEALALEMNLNIKEIDRIRLLANSTVGLSLDQPLVADERDSNACSLLDMLPAPTDDYQGVDFNTREAVIGKFIEIFGNRLNLRFRKDNAEAALQMFLVGFGDVFIDNYKGEDLNYKKIGEDFGLTRERVRQIFAICFLIIRNCEKLKSLLVQLCKDEELLKRYDLI